LTTEEFLAQAGPFERRLEETKRRLKGEWYPYPTFASLTCFTDLIRRAPCGLDALLGKGPIADIGCADGDLAFFLESIGYQVDAIDYSKTNYSALRGIQALKSELKSNVQVHDVDLDAQFALPSDRYSFIFFLGILYHLKNPYYALERLARSTRRMMLSTRVARFAPDRGTELHALPVAWLLDEREANNDPTNYWIFSEAGLRRILHRTGWTVTAYTTTGDTRHSNPVSSGADERAFCLLESRFGSGFDQAAELVGGFHPVEEGGWRWTEKRFTIRVAAGCGSVLRMGLALPERLAAQVCPVTLSATANGVPLPPETLSAAGSYLYTRRLPPGDGMEIAFTLDRALEPGEHDWRELGVIVTSLEIAG
jgi:tRNA (mo5U34)-methyltransferase